MPYPTQSAPRPRFSNSGGYQDPSLNRGGPGNPGGAYNNPQAGSRYGAMQGNPYPNSYSGQSPYAGRYRPPTMTGANTWDDQGGYSYNLPNSFGPAPDFGEFNSPYAQSYNGGGGGGGRPNPNGGGDPNYPSGGSWQPPQDGPDQDRTDDPAMQARIDFLRANGMWTPERSAAWREEQGLPAATPRPDFRSQYESMRRQFNRGGWGGPYNGDTSGLRYGDGNMPPVAVRPQSKPNFGGQVTQQGGGALPPEPATDPYQDYRARTIRPRWGRG